MAQIYIGGDEPFSRFSDIQAGIDNRAASNYFNSLHANQSALAMAQAQQQFYDQMAQREASSQDEDRYKAAQLALQQQAENRLNEQFQFQKPLSLAELAINAKRFGSNPQADNWFLQLAQTAGIKTEDLPDLARSLGASPQAVTTGLAARSAKAGEEKLGYDINQRQVAEANYPIAAKQRELTMAARTGSGIPGINPSSYSSALADAFSIPAGPTGIDRLPFPNPLGPVAGWLGNYFGSKGVTPDALGQLNPVPDLQLKPLQARVKGLKGAEFDPVSQRYISSFPPSQFYSPSQPAEGQVTNAIPSAPVASVAAGNGGQFLRNMVPVIEVATGRSGKVPIYQLQSALQNGYRLAQ